MPDLIDFDSEQELTDAGARAMDLHAAIVGGATPDQADLIWLCRMLHAALTRIQPIPKDPRPAPAWLRERWDDFDARR